MSPLAWTISLLAVWVCGVVGDYTAVVNVTAGSLRGVTSPKGYYSYLGIPYGTVEKRFQAATPVTSWTGILDATDGNVQCKQKNPIAGTAYKLFLFASTALPEVVGSKDCLNLNVYTNADPTETQTTLRPVMVYIFGGAYMFGSGATALYGPEFLLQKDVVVVTINYRLDILGFLCLGIEEAPGNAAFKDQVLALKWVQQNIKVFGGDPDNVTIFGESAGGGSVGLHLVSPMSKGLFHKAIMQSGAPVAPWNIQYEPIKQANKLANLFGYNTTDPYELYNIFMNVSDEELQAMQIPREEGQLFIQELLFIACAENDIPGVEPFLTDIPYNIIANNSYTKVPILIGHTSKEGYTFISLENETTIAGVNNQFRNTFYGDLSFSSEEEANAVANQARQLYFGNATINSTNLVDYMGDYGFVYSVSTTIDLLLKTSNEPIYAYNLAYNGTRNLAKNLLGFLNYPGAGHFDDIYYLFNPVFLSTLTATEQDLAIIGNMTTMWTNFAKYGNPTPEGSTSLPSWEPVDADDPTVLVIDEQFSIEQIWNERMLFWNTTYSQYRTKSVQQW